MQLTEMANLPDSGDSHEWLENSRVRASPEHEEAVLIRPRTASLHPLYRTSLASSTEEDDFEQNSDPDQLTTDFRAAELLDRQLSPEDDRYSSSTDFLSVVTVNDFGFASSWSRQLQQYAANDRWINLDNDLGREEHRDQEEQPSTEKSPFLTSDNPRSFGDQFLPIYSAHSLTIQELSQDLGGTIDDGMRPNDPVAYLCKELLSQSELSKHGSSGSKFIPHDKLCTILNEYNVFCLLKHIFPQDPGTRLRDRVAEICSYEHRLSRRMILAILVLVDQPNYIDDFISHKIYDVHLPLREPRALTSGDHAQFNILFHKRQDKDSSEPHAFFEHWRAKHMMDFLKWQYSVLSPFLKIGGDRVCFYNMEEKIILPFIECYEPRETQVGAQGSVWKVKIHPAHFDFVSPEVEVDQNPFFAVKAMFSEEFEHIRDEVRVLERYSGSVSGHTHIIRLLMWFKHGRRYYLLFPWATGNLADYWKRHPSPTPTVHDTLWLIEQCYGMANGLTKIHNHSSWSRKRRINGHDQGELLERDLGRHGDVKPENLLFFNVDRRIVIADFGLTRFRSAQGRSALSTSKNVRGFSRTYCAPEFEIEAEVSQKSDVWSLGCVYLEFISWYLLGYEKTRGGGVDTFVRLRSEDDDRRSSASEDKFFNLRAAFSETVFTADVKDSVKKWILDLRRLKNCSVAIGDFLDLVELDMLVPDVQARASMQRIQHKMNRIAYQCRSIDNYCTDPSFSAPVTRNPGAQSAIGELRHSAVVQYPSVYGPPLGHNLEGVDDPDLMTRADVTFGSLDAIIETVQDKKTLENVAEVLDPPKRQVIEIRVLRDIARAFLGHQGFKSRCSTSIDNVAAEKSRAHIRGFLKVYGLKLDEQARDPLQHQAAKVIQKAAGRIADEIRLSITGSKEAMNRESAAEEKPGLEKWLATPRNGDPEKAPPQPPANNDNSIEEESEDDLGTDEAIPDIDAVKDFLLTSQAFGSLLGALDDWSNVERGLEPPTTRSAVSSTTQSLEKAALNRPVAHKDEFTEDHIDSRTYDKTRKSSTDGSVIDPTPGSRSRVNNPQSLVWNILDFWGVTFSVYDLFDLFIPSPPADSERLRWRCTCNTILWGDFPTEDSYALQQLKEDLLGNLSPAPNSSRTDIYRDIGTARSPESHGEQPKPGHEKDGRSNITSNLASTSGNMASSSSSGEQHDKHSSPELEAGKMNSLSAQPPINLTQVTVDTCKPVYFEVCTNIGNSAVGHFELDISRTTTDGELFEKIWCMYNRNRGIGLRRLFLRPCNVHFVLFSISTIKTTRYSAGIHGKPAEYPPDMELQHRRYHYHTPKIMMPSHVFIHFLHRARMNVWGDHTNDTWLKRLPKKLNESMLAVEASESSPDSDLVFGWGIHILDGPNHAVLSFFLAVGIAVTFAISCLMMGIAKTQEQAFGVGSYLIAIVVACMSAVYFKLQDQ